MNKKRTGANEETQVVVKRCNIHSRETNLNKIFVLNQKLKKFKKKKT